MNRDFAKLKRRDLLRLACLSGLSLVIPLTRLVETRSVNPEDSELQRSINALGTTVTIKVEEAYNPVKALAGIADAFSEIRRLESQLTRFERSSQVYRLNSIGELETPTPELAEVLDRARCFSDRTGGAFDVTVKPALDLLQNLLVNAALPSDAEFEAVRRLIDFELLSFSKDAVSFAERGMGITLDCIGKGYVLDRAAERLRSHGICSALVRGGGTLVAIGARLDGSPWKIGVRDPGNPEGLIGTISLVDGAVATSGDYENSFSTDRRYYHIIDPTSARSPLYAHSATVTARTAAQADPLGVTLMVKEPREGLRLLESFKACECLVVTREGSHIMSSGFGAIP